MIDQSLPGIGHNLPPFEGTGIPDPERLACPYEAVATLGDLVPAKWIDRLEANELIEDCCRDPKVNGSVGAFYSSDAEQSKGVPDIYIIRCTCGRGHAHFMVGGGLRPYWG